MGVLIDRVQISSNPTQLPCPPVPTQKFTVTVKVDYRAQGALGGHYNVQLYDKDRQVDGQNQDDLLDELHSPYQQVTPSTAGTHTHTFKLSCDSNCKVKGPSGSSNERSAQLKAKVYDVADVTNAKWSQMISVSCGTPPSPKEEEYMRQNRD